MIENQIIISIALALLGLSAGSFAGALLWRMRAKQLVEDKKAGDKVDPKEFKRLKSLTKSSIVNGRSQCLDCGYTLKWYDLLPLVSWVSLKGNCRQCKHPIGRLEPILEVGVAAFFVVSFLLWPHELNGVLPWLQLAVWLLAGVLLASLMAYDKKWMLLPDKLNFAVIGVGVIFSGLVLLQSESILDTLVGIGGSVAILSGLYFVLHIASKGRLVGFGDVKLGLGLALLLADWQLAFVALFAANLIGCLIVVPGLLSGKLKRNSRVPFGPFLMAGWLVAGLFGAEIINFYLDLLILGAI